MKTSLGWSVCRVRRHAAFTLIELLTVMAIILVLAGLIINVAGSANYNAAKSRATTEIKSMETALENYKSDNGAYPSDSSNVNSGTQPTTEVLDAKDTTNFHDPAKYTNSSEFLYQALSGFQITSAAAGGGVGGATITKAYMPFRPDQLHVASNASADTKTATPNSPYMYIIDPFGFSYGYSTVYAATLAANNASANAAGGTPAAATPVTKGYNPTFDLWSTGGYAAGGKSTPTNLTSVGTDAQIYSSLWIKNW